MAINQIKVANEAKQDITISKADQILGKLADQTIIAKTVKSVQRGVVQIPTDNLVGNFYQVVASISSVNISKCDVFYALGVEGIGDSRGNSGIYLDSMTSSSLTFHVGKKGNLAPEYFDGRFSWQVIEFY